MFPKTTIIIDRKGNSRIEGEEKSDQCFKLRDLARTAGKVQSIEDKDHTPVYHDVTQKTTT